MKINRNNYESYFIDYLDGTLSPEMVSELLLFLDENPDLQEELDDLDTAPLPADLTIQYTDKQLLKKKSIVSVGPIHELNYQEYLIGSVEGDLSIPGIRTLERFLLRNPQANRELDQFRATRLSPDLSVVYNAKDTLKKYPFGISARKVMYYISGAAAILLITLMVIHPFRKNEPVMVEEKQMNPEITGDSSPVRKDGPAEPAYTASLSQDRPGERTPPVMTGPSATGVIETPSAAKISTIQPIHRGIQYQLVNTSYSPDREIRLAGERNLYSQALPYLTEADQYTLATWRTDHNESGGSFGEIARSKFREIFSGDRSKIKGLQNINLWTIADLGVAGINQIANSDLRIERIKNEEGRIISYALVNEKREITRTRMKNNTGQPQQFE